MTLTVSRSQRHPIKVNVFIHDNSYYHLLSPSIFPAIFIIIISIDIVQGRWSAHFLTDPLHLFKVDWFADYLCDSLVRSSGIWRSHSLSLSLSHAPSAKARPPAAHQVARSRTHLLISGAEVAFEQPELGCTLIFRAQRDHGVTWRHEHAPAQPHVIVVEDLSGAACEVRMVHLKEDKPLTLGLYRRQLLPTWERKIKGLLCI